MRHVPRWIWKHLLAALLVAVPTAAIAQDVEEEEFFPSPVLRWSGYADVGAAYAFGDGAGHVQDSAHTLFPEFIDVGWVFAGDPLATAINSRGEPSDTGSASERSRAVAFDPVDSEGHFTFLINEVNLDLMAAASPTTFAFLSLDLVPRTRDVSVLGNPDTWALGDFIEIDRAWVEWLAYATDDTEIVFQLGKFQAVPGIEYRVQESPDRFGITPSLIYRYTAGNPTGLKSRMKFFDQRFVINLSLTNGSHFIELFPFFDEIDSNHVPTGAGRISYTFDLGGGLEIGASGVLGAQDLQSENTILQWLYAVDLQFWIAGLELRAEFVDGRAEGRSSLGARPSEMCVVEPDRFAFADEAPCLDFRGAYGQVSYFLTNWLGAMARVGWRDAVHEDLRPGAGFVYVVDVLRVTGALRFDIDPYTILKLEYLHNRELGRLPEIDNDIVTTSLVRTF